MVSLEGKGFSGRALLALVICPHQWEKGKVEDLKLE
jgi:hypothetical protein